MSCTELWDRQELSWEDVPSLQELLRSCDKDRLVQTIIDDHVLRAAGDDALSHKRRRSLEKRIAPALDAMCELDVKKKRNHTSVILPEESFIVHAHSGLIERKLSATLTTLDDVFAAQSAVEAWTCHMVAPAREQNAADASVAWPKPQSYTLKAWEDTLAARVWLGGSWCCRERYLVLASAFWEMTYYGFEHDRVIAGQMRAKALVTLHLNEHDVPKVPTTVSELAHQRAVAFGLVVPDVFREDFCDRVAARVGELNDAAHLDFWCRLIDLSHRLGRTGSSKAA